MSAFAPLVELSGHRISGPSAVSQHRLHCCGEVRLSMGRDMALRCKVRGYFRGTRRVSLLGLHCYLAIDDFDVMLNWWRLAQLAGSRRHKSRAPFDPIETPPPTHFIRHACTRISICRGTGW